MADKKQQIVRPDEMPAHRAQIPHSTHSLSHKSDITAACAHLMPIFYDYLNAGEVVDLAIPFRLITEPLLTYSSAHLTVHTEYFFVPMQLLYQPFGDWYFGIRDQFSDVFNVDKNTPFTLPLLNVGDIQKSASALRASVIGSVNNSEVVGRRVARLFDLLDLPTNGIFSGLNDISQSFPTPPDWVPQVSYKTFPYGLLAYNCIYQYFYRLDNREKFRPKYFNVDSYFADNDISFPSWSQYDIMDMMSIKYRPLDNDYFTDIKVSPIVDVLNLNDKSLLSVADSWLSRFSSTSGQVSSPVLTSGSLGVDGESVGNSPMSHKNPSIDIQTNFGFSMKNNGAQGPSNGLDINTANLRAMFASEKLWSITGRAKKRYDDQVLAHFGFKVPHDPKHEITRFGHDVTPIDIGMVLNTGASADIPLGEIAGKGRADGRSSHHRFTAPCHGVVMAIMSIVPEISYYDYRSKYTVVRNRSDLFINEFDHLGMQPLFAYEMGFNYESFGDMDNFTPGYQYRYEQWKRRFNKVSSAYRAGASRASWVVSRTPRLYEVQGVVAPDMNAANTESFYSFLHFPQETNSIFVPQYSREWSTAFDGTWDSSLIYEADPFNIHLDIQCSLRSNMSDYSLPRLDA